MGIAPLRARPPVARRASAITLLLALASPSRGALAWGNGAAPAPESPLPSTPPAPASPPAAPGAGAPTAGSDVEGPMRPEAAALYTRGLDRFGARDYPAAIADLEAGYALDPRREFLFAEGQAKRLAGDCKGAVALYQRFLATNPAAVQANATQIALGRCAQHLAAHPEVVVVRTPGQPLPPPPPPPWWHDPFGLGLTGAGVVGIGVGVGFLAASYAAQHDAGNTPKYDPYDQRWSTAESRWEVGVGMLALGTALIAVGVTRFVLLRQQAHEAPPPTVSIGPGQLQVGGTF